jgi:hypothetical protein
MMEKGRERARAPVKVSDEVKLWQCWYGLLLRVGGTPVRRRNSPGGEPDNGIFAGWQTVSATPLEPRGSVVLRILARCPLGIAHVGERRLVGFLGWQS